MIKEDENLERRRLTNKEKEDNGKRKRFQKGEE